MLLTIDSCIEAHTQVCEHRLRNTLKMAHACLHGRLFACRLQRAPAAVLIAHLLPALHCRHTGDIYA